MPHSETVEGDPLLRRLSIQLHLGGWLFGPLGHRRRRGGTAPWTRCPLMHRRFSRVFFGIVCLKTWVGLLIWPLLFSLSYLKNNQSYFIHRAISELTYVVYSCFIFCLFNMCIGFVVAVAIYSTAIPVYSVMCLLSLRSSQVWVIKRSDGSWEASHFLQPIDPFTARSSSTTCYAFYSFVIPLLQGCLIRLRGYDRHEQTLSYSTLSVTGCSTLSESRHRPTSCSPRHD